MLVFIFDTTALPLCLSLSPNFKYYMLLTYVTNILLMHNIITMIQIALKFFEGGGGGEEFYFKIILHSDLME